MEEGYEILLAGTGGQGLGLAGVILARSFAEEEGKNVVETEAYGISMRGSHSRSEVLVSTGEINDLKVTEPDILLAMSQEAADFFIPKVKKSGSIFLDSTYVRDIPKTEAKVSPFPFTEEARSLGNEAIANVVALGAIASIYSMITKESLENTLKKTFGSPQREMNLQALDRGYELGEKREQGGRYGKKQQEIHETESIPWKAVEGYPGVYEKILNQDPETGSVTRLLRYDPGTVFNEVLRHDFYEEIYVLSGTLIDMGKNLTLKAGYYGYRHPGMEHGPYRSPDGMMTLEVRTYEK